ncbi:hypothetical protein [Primorskyibacter sp. 2E233]|uniref:hypothetical protein n=1 Tax=Primorskyibacter sp. 2E233 TaxID=3413431 RepID=UPI003BF31128
MSAVTTLMSRRVPTEVPFAGVLMALVFGFIGSTLCISAFGLWLVPGTAEMPGISLMKVGLSVFMLIGGMCFLVMARQK